MSFFYLLEYLKCKKYCHTKSAFHDFMMQKVFYKPNIKL